MKLISNFKLQISNLRGFTLIELIVVFTIIAILSTAGIASFASFSRQQILNQAANDLVNVLNTAKTRSASQIKPSQCSGTAALRGYSVSVNIAASSYAFNVICSGTVTSLSTFALPTGVSFNSALGSPPTTITNIVFPVISGGVLGTGNIVLSSYGLTKTIIITSVGGISIQ